jgi:transketolase C-terminal domain/subunit
MANINICDLRPIGSELFSDSEDYMNELGDYELHTINGGLSSPVCASITVSILSTVIASPLIVATKGKPQPGPERRSRAF